LQKFISFFILTDCPIEYGPIQPISSPQPAHSIDDPNKSKSFPAP